MADRVGIVVVSHSAALAEAATALALEMTPVDPPRVVLAAGTDDGGTGTDAMRVAEAVGEAAADGGGVLVLMDLGSAVLSAEMGLEFADTGGAPVRLTSAPIVEGLLAAVVTAAAGAPLDAVASEALGALGAKQAHLDEEVDGGPGGSVDGADGGGSAQTSSTPGTTGDAVSASATGSAPSATTEVTVLNTDGVHARPAALIVGALAGRDATLHLGRAGEDPVTVTGPTGLLTLGARQGETLTVSANGTDAEALLSDVVALFADGFGEATEPAAGAPATAASAGGDGAARSATESQDPPAPRATNRPAARPLGVSPGRVAGRVVRMPGPITQPTADHCDPALRNAEAARIDTAADETAAELRSRAALLREHSSGDANDHAATEGAAILEAGALIADDGDLRAAARRRVTNGEPAPLAVWNAFSDTAATLRGLGGRTAERAADLADVRDRIVASLTGQQAPGLPVTDEPYVLVAHDLAPADTALLDPRLCLALVTEEGGPTSHTAILARGLGIPAVVAARGAWHEAQGETLLVDGSTGELVWNPSPDLVAALAAQAEIAPFNGAGRTADGHSVPLYANVGKGGDAAAAAAALAEGVGLFRTEFCFLGRDEEPSIDEQIAAYREVLTAFPGKRVVVRTLDAGSDKPLAFVPTDPEENPALGVRGLRTSWVAPELLDRQLEAIAAAAAAEQAHLAVMAPMVSEVAEAEAFAERARAFGITEVGVMIETPSAALLADRLFEVVDFVSLGTNDLAQYTMAADRLLGSLATLNDPWQPAVVELIARAGAAGTAAGKSVGVCGEAASDPLLAAVLVGAGVTSLSMSPRALPAVATSLGEVSLAQCQEAAAAVISARGAGAARSAAASVLR